ncbi:MAG: tRNA (adenosine(37)-N6)-dimethylallyltransferase MiaA [Gemmobacter sp.]|jgi:tRNA dimethylallyltransferase|nr:tRNA (adenosine(37)-N6)-dimethylallyltransferase MiaA [Gemmobacter sp.]
MSENRSRFNRVRAGPVAAEGRGASGRKEGSEGQVQELPAGISAERPVLIAGPTASGKSALAMEIVARQGGIIVNADALQVYDRWRILTARPSIAEEAALPHRLYGHVGRDAAWSAGHWLRDLRAVLDEGLRPVIVGGTGLYFMALTEGLAAIPPVPSEVRAEADALRREDPAALVAGLDRATAAKTDLANLARVQRAWEVLHATGRGLVSWQRDTAPPLLPRAACAALVFRPDTAWLDARISARFDTMMTKGALEEVRAELPFWEPTRPSSRAIGAPELVAYLQGGLPLADAVAAAKLASRQYAKRQRSWFRARMADWTPVPLP